MTDAAYRPEWVPARRGNGSGLKTDDNVTVRVWQPKHPDAGTKLPPGTRLDEWGWSIWLPKAIDAPRRQFWATRHFATKEEAQRDALHHLERYRARGWKLPGEDAGVHEGTGLSHADVDEMHRWFKDGVPDE